MAAYSPPESMHALGLDGLRHPQVTFWTIWQNSDLLGCGALRELGPEFGEIKSMRTASTWLRKGVATRMLTYIVEEARRRGYRRLSLETGAQAEFAPARRLYASFGFTECDPFGDYVEDRNSVFMTLALPPWEG
jgi:putative acetyltransferase